MLKKEKKRAQDAINQLEESNRHLPRHNITSSSISHDQQLTNGRGHGESRHQSQEVHQSHDRSYGRSHERSHDTSSDQDEKPVGGSSHQHKDTKRLLGKY